MTNNITWLEQRIRGEGMPVLIDGGMGTHLEKSGVPMDDKVWSSRAVLSHPDAVHQAHEDFITAGAEVIITNTFSAARHMLEPGGLGDQVKEINMTAVKLAEMARDNVADKPVVIAGSVCEWTSSDDLKWHTPEIVGQSTREQVGILAEAGVDLIALEMCEQIEFSIVATEAALEFDLPIWIGVSARMHKGCESLSVFSYAEMDFENVVKRLSRYPAMMMNVMHTAVPDVEQAMEVVRKYWDGPVGVYPEAGYFNMPNWQFVDVIEPDELAKAAQAWIDNGVCLVGGCCGLGPEHIAALKQTLSRY
ncbi:MAG: homocysteine S-methyltransferase family protein [Gammaproteobacteria bacterium]|nr:homocysteine S-methyltransferase family protein [Gammaproteobacteria bacterium]